MAAFALLLEDGSGALLLEGGGRLLLESSTIDAGPPATHTAFTVSAVAAGWSVSVSISVSAASPDDCEITAEGA